MGHMLSRRTLIGGTATIAIATAATAQAIPRSIAVLPFATLSPDPENAYFAAGIHEEILNRLARIPDLRVIARSSVVRYANSDKSIKEIAKELDVASILEGSVRTSGARARITVQLIDVESDRLMWSNTYDRQMGDTFTIESEIADSVGSAVEAALSPGE